MGYLCKLLIEKDFLQFAEDKQKETRKYSHSESRMAGSKLGGKGFVGKGKGEISKSPALHNCGIKDMGVERGVILSPKGRK
jgi:hypothetical protein